MRRHIIALALASIAIPAAAQSTIGSGIEPSTVANSQTRPVEFAAKPGDGGVLAIIMGSAELPAKAGGGGLVGSGAGGA